MLDREKIRQIRVLKEARHYIDTHIREYMQDLIYESKVAAYQRDNNASDVEVRDVDEGVSAIRSKIANRKRQKEIAIGVGGVFMGAILNLTNAIESSADPTELIISLALSVLGIGLFLWGIFSD